MSLSRLQHGDHHDPFEVLGRHPHPAHQDGEIIRAFMPSAETVELEGFGAMQRVQGTDVFVACLNRSQAALLPEHYRLRWVEKVDNSVQEAISAYSFLPQIGELDLHLFGEGRHWRIWTILGANVRKVDGIDGCLFAVWAPAVRRVSVVGDFNGWNGIRHPMRSRGQSGVWELFVPGLQAGDRYKFEILSEAKTLHVKTDPYARHMGVRPDTVSIVDGEAAHPWGDDGWMRQRREGAWARRPMSVYEVHLGSWRQRLDGNGEFRSYRELADELIPYAKALGYTHLELLPVMEHPLDESWGYQVTGYYAPTSRFGGADDFRTFVDRCHQEGLGVLLDWVPAHFPKDEFALARFSGRPLYEHEDPRRGEHRDWGTLIFDYGRNEVRNFLIANVLYWLGEFHIDGLRVDAVASMLYLNYSRDEGDWVPNIFGGTENLEACAFLREMNDVAVEHFPGVVMIAEESTAWPKVTRPTSEGGLGFAMKWNMGWMHDTLNYFQNDPVHRRYHHNQLTFGQTYAYSEKFMLPFSHDEVVHLKKSLLSKMPGDRWQKHANLRLLHAYHHAQPGKKLLFMGSEFGQVEEWDAKGQLDWALLDSPPHQGIYHLVKDLNMLHRSLSPLHERDFDPEGFQWLDCDDADLSVLSFVRRSYDGSIVICVFNFTPVVRDGYRVGAPAAGRYVEVLNTDSHHYGGSDVGNVGGLQSMGVPHHGFENSLDLRLPPLGALFLRPECDL